ncbi:hypothetical protein KIH24_14470 [Rhizobiales bacterium TNE-4]|nr:hypothetical protein [Rhizobiales bacterium TNE-4]MBV1828825.1 hypothetical protein [Rhizobiales bacterium TNE-4]
MAGSRPRPIVPKSLSEAYRIAQAVCAAKMAPKGLDTPEACMIAIMHGLEVGLSPLSALQRIAVINGRPTIWGDGALALVKASGLCEAIEEWIEGDDPQSWIAICNLIRKHDPVPVERRFSTEDAKRAKLWGKSGPWSDYPKRILQMRARAFALRDAFPDVLGGLYLTEEFVAEPEAEAQSVMRFETEEPLEAGASLRPQTHPEPETRAKSEVRSETEAHPQPRFKPEMQGEAGSGFEFWNGARSVASLRPDKAAEPQANALPTNSDNTDVGHATAPDTASERFERAQSNDASINASGDWKTEEGDGQANAASVLVPTISSPLPPLANLRRSRSMPRHIRALRFRNQWSVKQPRGPRKELSQTNAVSSDQGQSSSPQRQSPSSSFEGPSSFYAKAPSSPEQAYSSDRVASRRTSSLEIQRQSVPEPSLTLSMTTQGQGFIPPDDITAHLDLYDAALCCATDPETLAEIAEEFTERLSQLPRSSRNAAELIFEKHQTRIGDTPTHGDRHD